MNIARLSSALSLVAFAPCVLGGQNPAPSSEHSSHHAGAAAPAMRQMVMQAAGHSMMMSDAASRFLGCTGQLQLTDSQVTRLATIARRADVRKQAMHARMDSAMTAMRSMDGSETPRDGAGPGMMAMMRMPMPSDAERKAQHADDREAFSVLTPDQLATAWEMMMAHHAAGGM